MVETTLVNALLSNLTYNEYQHETLLLGKLPLSATTFYLQLKKLQQIVITYFNQLLEKQISFVNSPIIVAFDTRWSARGFSAKESTTSCFFIDNNKEYHLFLLSIIKKRNT